MNRPIYIDTNVFISAFETTGDLSDWAWRILHAATRESVRILTSELTLAELLTKPIEVGSQLLVELYTGLLKDGGALTVSQVTRPVLIRSASVRAANRAIRLPDAIHVATALEGDCMAFVTNERRLQTPASLPLIRLNGESLRHVENLAH